MELCREKGFFSFHFSFFSSCDLLIGLKRVFKCGFLSKIQLGYGYVTHSLQEASSGHSTEPRGLINVPRGILCSDD